MVRYWVTPEFIGSRAIANRWRSLPRVHRHRPVNLKVVPNECCLVTIDQSIWTRSTNGGGRGCNNFVPVLGGDGIKIAPTGDIFDQPPGGMS